MSSTVVEHPATWRLEEPVNSVAGAGEGWDAAMAAKPQRGLRESVDDLLGDLLGYDDESPVNSVRTSQLARGSSGRARGTSSPASQRSFVEEDFFSRFPAEDVEAAEGSSASGGEPQALLQSLKDMDNLEADLLGISRPDSGPGKPIVKGPGKCDSSGGAVKTAGKLLAPGKGESGPAMEKPQSSFPASQQYREFNFEDLDDPLSGLLSDEEQDAPKKPCPTGTKSISEKKTEQSKEKEPPPAQMSLCTAAPVQSRKELTFEDDGDDLMAALGLGSGPGRDEKQTKKAEDREEVRPARAMLDELLGRGSVARILEEPGLGERREFKLEKKYQKQPEKEEGWDKEDFVFGAYQPSVASTAKGRPARRQPLSRFSAENSSEPKAEPHSKASPSASQSPARGCRTGGDWLGLKDEDFMDLELLSPAKASPAGRSPSPATAGRPGPTRQLPGAEEAAAKPDAVEEEDWLSAALSRKKAQAQAKAQERNAKASEAPVEGLNPGSPVSRPAASPGARPQAATVQDEAASTDSSGPPLLWLSTAEQASAPPSEAAQGDPSRDASAPVPAALFLGEQETQRPAPLAQAESPGLGLLHERRLGAPTAQPHEDATGCQAALLHAQARVAELESQVRTLELARAQDRLLLESLRQRHQEDLDLLESSHRSQVKLLEETCRQREQRLRQEKEQLAAQLLGQRQEAEQARAELLAQHQQHLAALEQRNALELERLRELQSGLLARVLQGVCAGAAQRPRRAAPAAEATEGPGGRCGDQHHFAQTLNGVIEQMEKFSSDLRDILHRVEATHHITSQELAMGAQKQQKQLKVLQDSLWQQQRDSEEERRRLQEVVAKLEARLGDQTRLLEQERQRVLAERSRAESLQHWLEEERRVVTQQLSVERVELERAKSALLEEQMSVLQKCAEERRKLVAKWAEFHTQQPLSKERDTARVLGMDSQGEDPVRSLAKERAEVKMQVHMLRAQEEQLAREKELLDEAWQELKLEQEKVNGAALRVRQQEEELKSVTELSSQKYEEGQRALREARRVESQDQSRLQALQRQLEQLRQQEEHLHQDRLSMAQQRSQLQQLRQELPNSPTMLRTAGRDSSAPASGFSSALFPLTAAVPHNRASVPGFPPAIGSLGGIRELLAMASSAELSATLAMMKFWAQQDHAYLENEQFFLESLKKASYNAASLPG
ncbi:fas-binding factor 1 homolog isoform X1 [Strix aluco]|uniref:fas-binding factor 1 homolog isoform X1 n=1 Tax=Strix aluco TaxID=111821 RepID=UPI003DA2A5A9